MTLNYNVIVLVVFLLFVSIFLIPIIFLLAYHSRSRSNISTVAVNYIRQYFPYLNAQVFGKGGLRDSVDVRAETTDPSAPIQFIGVFQKMRHPIGTKRGRMVSYLSFEVDLHPQALGQYNTFSLSITRQGLLDAIKSNENIQLGIKALDTKLLFQGEPSQAATTFLNEHLAFVQALADRPDLLQCTLNFYGNSIRFVFEAKDFTPSSLKSAFYILQLLFTKNVPNQ